MTRILMCGPVATSGGVSAHTKFLMEALCNIGNNVILFNFSEKKWFLNPPVSKIYQRTVGLIITAIKKRKKYDIIHVQTSGGVFSFISSITGCFIAKMINKPIIVTFHHSKTEQFVRNYAQLFGMMLKYTHKLVLVSDRQKQVVMGLFPQFSKKLIVIPNGYNPKLFYPRSKEECRSLLDLPLDKKIIINLSNLIESKGHKYLIEAMYEISKQRNDIICYIVGAGPLKESLEFHIRKLKMDNYVKLIGWKPDEDLPIWINASDLFVHPSLAESFGIVQIEAMACGKPVVATRNGGSEGLLTSDVYGILCETRDVDGLADSILKGIEKDWDRSSIIEYSNRFEWKFIADEITSLYTSI